MTTNTLLRQRRSSGLYHYTQMLVALMRENIADAFVSAFVYHTYRLKILRGRPLTPRMETYILHLFCLYCISKNRWERT